MGQFFPDNNSRLPASLETEKIEPFVKAAYTGEEIKKMLEETGKAINPNGTEYIPESTK